MEPKQNLKAMRLNLISKACLLLIRDWLTPKLRPDKECLRSLLRIRVARRVNYYQPPITRLSLWDQRLILLCFKDSIITRHQITLKAEESQPLVTWLAVVASPSESSPESNKAPFRLLVTSKWIQLRLMAYPIKQGLMGLGDLLRALAASKDRKELMVRGVWMALEEPWAIELLAWLIRMLTCKRYSTPSELALVLKHPTWDPEPWLDLMTWALAGEWQWAWFRSHNLH